MHFASAVLQLGGELKLAESSQHPRFVFCQHTSNQRTGDPKGARDGGMEVSKDAARIGAIDAL